VDDGCDVSGEGWGVVVLGWFVGCFVVVKVEGGYVVVGGGEGWDLCVLVLLYLWEVV